MSVEYNNKSWLALLFLLFLFIFYSLYFYVNSCYIVFYKSRGLWWIRNWKTNWFFSRDDLRSTHRLFLCLQFGPFLSSYQHSTFLKPHLPKPPWHLLCLRHTTQIYPGGINAACTMWLVKVKNSSDGRGQLVKKQVQWAEGVRDK